MRNSKKRKRRRFGGNLFGRMWVKMFKTREEMTIGTGVLIQEVPRVSL